MPHHCFCYLSLREADDDLEGADQPKLGDQRQPGDQPDPDESQGAGDQPKPDDDQPKPEPKPADDQPQSDRDDDDEENRRRQNLEPWLRREGVPPGTLVSKRGDVFSPVVISMIASGIHLRTVTGLRGEALRKRGLDEMDYLPLDGQREVESQYKSLWRNEPLQRHKISIQTDERGYGADTLARTITSDYTVALFERFGGKPWFKIFVATGEVTNELVDMVNEHNAAVIRKKGDREPSSSRIGGAKLSERAAAVRRGEEPPPPKGVQHKVSTAKSLRKEAGILDKQMAEERQKYYDRYYRGPTMTRAQWNDLVRRREAIVAAVAAG